MSTGTKARPYFSNYMRFSLRMLAVGLTVLCVAMGRKANNVAKQRNAVAAILASGGRITYEHSVQFGNREYPIRGQSPSKVSALLSRYIPHDWLYSVEGVALFGDACNDNMLKHVSELSSLKELGLWAAAEPPVDRGFGGTDNPKLPRSGVSDNGLNVLSSLNNLESITFLGNSLTDNAVQTLMTFPALKTVQMDIEPYGSAVSPEAHSTLQIELAERLH